MKALVIIFWFAAIGLVEAACPDKIIITRKDGSEVSYFVEIADGIFSRARGLMHRNTLNLNHGILFRYDSETPVSFWMKNVSFPLDLVFVAGSGTIVKFTKMQHHSTLRPFILVSQSAPFSKSMAERPEAPK